MKSQRETINVSYLELDDSGALELLYEYGGANKKYHLYGRDKRIGSLKYIGTLEMPATKIPDATSRGRKAAEFVLQENYEILEGLERLDKFTIRPLCWAEKEEGNIPKKS